METWIFRNCQIRWYMELSESDGIVRDMRLPSFEYKRSSIVKDVQHIEEFSEEFVQRCHEVSTRLLSLEYKNSDNFTLSLSFKWRITDLDEFIGQYSLELYKWYEEHFESSEESNLAVSFDREWDVQDWYYVASIYIQNLLCDVSPKEYIKDYCEPFLNLISE